jgi:hypothetical protein
MPAVTAESAKTAAPPLKSPLATVLLAWLLPGAGHYWLGRKGRGVLVFGAVLACFVAGVAMNGPFFSPSSTGDMLSRLIQIGGFVGDLASGLFYLIAAFSGYGPPDQPGHVPDYGSKFIVAAGILNILAMVDAYEITTRLKD